MTVTLGFPVATPILAPEVFTATPLATAALAKLAVAVLVITSPLIPPVILPLINATLVVSYTLLDAVALLILNTGETRSKMLRARLTFADPLPGPVAYDSYKLVVPFVTNVRKLELALPV